MQVDNSEHLQGIWEMVEGMMRAERVAYYEQNAIDPEMRRQVEELCELDFEETPAVLRRLVPSDDIRQVETVLSSAPKAMPGQCLARSWEVDSGYSAN